MNRLLFPKSALPAVVEGKAEAILEVAETCQCELIVMGTRGLGRLGGLLLGSRAQKVISLAHCPVLVVK
jgi:nucleotide-binding universal stress UspA family protein